MEYTNNDKEASPAFHILALSGGGFRGLYTATVLALLEERVGEPLGRRFDLICGTSVGGIIALALALEIPMSQIRDLFKEQGADIFQRRETWMSQLRMLFRAKHGQRKLRKALEDKFGNRELGEARHPVLIPAVNYSKGGPQVFKTPHHASFERDWRLRVVDIALATSAAPVYLPMAKIDGRGVYVDGGLYANAPGLLGVHEARTFFQVPDEKIHVLSVGTMSSELTARGNPRLNPGVFGWGTKLFNLMISAQESMAHYMLQHQLQERYFQIDAKPSKEQDADLALDIASPAAIETLTSRADGSYQGAIGDAAFARFNDHVAAPPVFWHGPNITRVYPE